MSATGNKPTLELALSASAGGCDVALRVADGSVKLFGEAPGTRADDLAPRISQSLKDEGATMRDVRSLRIDLGPGSYTGLRVAVTFVRTVQCFLGASVFATTSLQLIALQAWKCGVLKEAETAHPVLDARRNRFHHARIRLVDTTELLSAPAAVEAHDLFASIAPNDVVLADASLHAMFENTRVETIEPWRADLLFDERLEVRETPGERLEPLYLMGSYAEQSK